MGRVTKKIGAAALTAAMAGALVLVNADAASAINRVSCNNPDYLWLSSNSTTCWAYAGTAYVTLYDVYGLSSGNNAGYVYGAPYTTTFAKWASGSMPQRTITEVRIY